jgi:hypothetical protein
MPFNVPLTLISWADQFVKNRLGSDFSIHDEGYYWVLRVIGSRNRIFISCFEDFYRVQSEIGPTFLYSDVDLPSLGAPMNKPTCWSHASGDQFCNFDIIGFAYWAMNRLEEYNAGPSKLDKYGRFKSSCSHAFLNGYLDRPLVDEWIHHLRAKCKKVWPDTKLKTFNYEVEISHDVDSVLRYGAISPVLFLKKLFRGSGDESLFRFIYAPLSYLAQNIYLCPFDPENNFDWIMNTSDQAGIKSTFFFISGMDILGVDPRYLFRSTSVRSLMKNINSRGHFIGLHPSLNSTFHLGQIKFEWDELQQVTALIGSNPVSARMHYLQWVAGITSKELVSAGISKDWSLGYADCIGFRASTCHPYELFNPISLVPFGIEMRPLIIMDRTLTSRSYMNLHDNEILDCARNVAGKCHAVSGNMSILWHNGQLASKQQRQLYKNLLKVVCNF